MKIVIDVNVLFEHIGNMRALQHALSNCVEFINDTIERDRISDKDAKCLIRYLDTKLRNIIQLSVVSSERLNKCHELEKLVIDNTQFTDDIMFTISDKKYKDFLGIKYTSDKYEEMILYLKDIQPFIKTMLKNLESLSNDLSNDMEIELKKQKDKIKFQDVKPYLTLKPENYREKLEEILEQLENLDAIINTDIDELESYLIDCNILKTRWTVLEAVDDDQEFRYKLANNKDLFYIFMAFDENW
jgi:hypothetical protein